MVWMRAAAPRPRRHRARASASDISARIQRLYAPPAAWSHGYLWGADVVTIPTAPRFSPRTERIKRPNRLDGGVVKKRQAGGAATRSRSTRRPRCGRSTSSSAAAPRPGSRRRRSSARPGRHRDLPRRAKHTLDDVGEEHGLTFTAIRGACPRASGSRGCRASPSSTGTDCRRPEHLGAAPARVRGRPVLDRRRSTPRRPTRWPATTCSSTLGRPPASPPAPPSTMRRRATRLAAFFAGGGGYIGGQNAGATFLTAGGQVTGPRRR